MEFTIDDQFKNNDPIVRDIYEALMKKLELIGLVTVEPKKTSLHLKNKSGFAGVHTRKSAINLEFVSSAGVKDPRVLKGEQVSKSRFHNLVKLTQVGDIDDQL